MEQHLENPNCAACHRNGAGGAVPAHLNVDKKLAELRVLDAKPTRGDFGLTDARVIAPGRSYSSALLWRIATEGAGHMPAIGSRTVDEKGLSLILSWITSLNSDRSASHVNGASEALALATADLDPNMNFNKGLIQAGSISTNALVRDLFQRFLPSEQRRRTLGQALAVAGRQRGRHLGPGVGGAGGAFRILAGVVEAHLIHGGIVSPWHRPQGRHAYTAGMVQDERRRRFIGRALAVSAVGLPLLQPRATWAQPETLRFAVSDSWVPPYVVRARGEPVSGLMLDLIRLVAQAAPARAFSCATWSGAAPVASSIARQPLSPNGTRLPGAK